MQKLIYILTIGTISLLLFQCKAKKPLLTDVESLEINSKLKADTVVSNLLKNNFEYTNLKAKVRTKFNSREKQNLTFNTFIKMKKDSTIHATISVAGIPIIVALILITPDSLKFLNKKDREYFVGEFSYIKEVLKTDITFNEIQSLLVGNPIRLDSNENNYLIEENNEIYLSSMSQSKMNQRKSANPPSAKWLIKYWVNELYKPGKTLLENDSAATQINIIQADFNKVDGQLFPNRTQAEIITPNDSVFIQLNYQRVKINTDMDYDFVIPSHYTPITP